MAQEEEPRAERAVLAEPAVPQEPKASGTDPAGAPEVPRESLRQRIAARGLPREAHDRIAVFAVRAIFFLAAGGLGIAGARMLNEVTGRYDIEPLLGVLVGCGAGGAIILLEMLFSRSPLRVLAAITFGLILGLALSLVFQFVVEFIVTAVTTPEFRSSDNGPKLLSFLHMLTATIFCYFGVANFLRTRDDFKFIIPYVEFRREVKRHAPLIFDTSCFVDGRIQAVLGTGVFDQRLVVPKFVLTELQTIADSADRSLRERGRRGLDILHEIEGSTDLEVLDHGLGPGETVDDALLVVASVLGGKVVTTDFNLQKNARLQGVAVININDLANAVKPTFVPGEILTVRLIREGEEAGQAVGFLRDGTMVVVENGRGRIGQEATVEVTSALQTSAGRMVFGKLRGRGKAGEP